MTREELILEIKQRVFQNNNQLITGINLQNTLIDMVNFFYDNAEGQKLPARFTTTGAITLSGLGTQGNGDWGSSLTAGDRILVKNQASLVNNGLYSAAAGVWTRTDDFNEDAEVIAGTLIIITEGTTLSDSLWELTTNNPIVVGVSSLNFSRIGADVILVIDTTLSAIETLRNNSQLIPGISYKATDLDEPVLLFATNNQTLALKGNLYAKNADYQAVGDYSGVQGITTVAFTANQGIWTVAIDGTVVNGDVVIWNNLNYQVTAAGSVDGTNPATNTGAYTLLLKSNTNQGYITEVDSIEYDSSDNSSANWGIILRKDKRDNFINTSLANNINLGFSPIDRFQWGRTGNEGNVNNYGELNNMNCLSAQVGIIVTGAFSSAVLTGKMNANNSRFTGANTITSSEVTNNVVASCKFHSTTFNFVTPQQGWNMNNSKFKNCNLTLTNSDVTGSYVFAINVDWNIVNGTITQITAGSGGANYSRSNIFNSTLNINTSAEITFFNMKVKNCSTFTITATGEILGNFDNSHFEDTPVTIDDQGLGCDYSKCSFTHVNAITFTGQITAVATRAYKYGNIAVNGIWVLDKSIFENYNLGVLFTNLSGSNACYFNNNKLDSNNCTLYSTNGNLFIRNCTFKKGTVFIHITASDTTFDNVTIQAATVSIGYTTEITNSDFSGMIVKDIPGNADSMFDPEGAGLKIADGDGLSFLRTRFIGTNADPLSTTYSYQFVNCTNILLDDTIFKNSSGTCDGRLRASGAKVINATINITSTNIDGFVFSKSKLTGSVTINTNVSNSFVECDIAWSTLNLIGPGVVIFGQNNSPHLHKIHNSNLAITNTASLGGQLWLHYIDFIDVTGIIAANGEFNSPYSIVGFIDNNINDRRGKIQDCTINLTFNSNGDEPIYGNRLDGIDWKGSMITIVTGDTQSGALGLFSSSKFKNSTILINDQGKGCDFSKASIVDSGYFNVVGSVIAESFKVRRATVEIKGIWDMNGSTVADSNTLFYFHNDNPKITNEVIAVGDGTTGPYPFSLVNFPIAVGQANPFITDTVEFFTDNGDGTLTGDNGGSGTINYNNGTGSLTFGSAVTISQNITATYRRLCITSCSFVRSEFFEMRGKLHSANGNLNVNKVFARVSNDGIWIDADNTVVNNMRLKNGTLSIGNVGFYDNTSIVTNSNFNDLEIIDCEGDNTQGEGVQIKGGDNIQFNNVLFRGNSTQRGPVNGDAPDGFSIWFVNPTDAVVTNTQFDSCSALMKNDVDIQDSKFTSTGSSPNQPIYFLAGDTIKFKRLESGFSNLEDTVDITGLTTLNVTDATKGIFYLTSTNATETINKIGNSTAKHKFTLRPEPGLILTIVGTPILDDSDSDSLGAQPNDIVLPTPVLVLDGSNGDWAEFEEFGGIAYQTDAQNYI